LFGNVSVKCGFKIFLSTPHPKPYTATLKRIFKKRSRIYQLLELPSPSRLLHARTPSSRHKYTQKKKGIRNVFNLPNRKFNQYSLVRVISVSSFVFRIFVSRKNSETGDWLRPRFRIYFETILSVFVSLRCTCSRAHVKILSRTRRRASACFRACFDRVVYRLIVVCARVIRIHKSKPLAFSYLHKTKQEEEEISLWLFFLTSSVSSTFLSCDHEHRDRRRRNTNQSFLFLTATRIMIECL